MKRLHVLRRAGVLIVLALGLAALSCEAQSEDPPAENSASPTATVAATPGGGASAAPASRPGRILPEDLVYQGAFRLPDGPEEYDWNWGGQALAYCAEGDAAGPADGYAGSLFGTGHNWHTWVSEISIPKPVISPGKNVQELNTAGTLQEFADIRGSLYDGRDLEQPRVGLAYLPAQGEQTGGKLYFCWAAHMGQENRQPSHGWCERDLSAPRPAGLWNVGGLDQYITCDYLAPIAPAWAKLNTPGMLLVTGRMRDGGQVSQGPTLVAYGPWNEGNPPPPDAQLKATLLLKYSDITAEQQHKMKGYHHSDDWSGVAWLTSGGRSAVVFAGTKGQGECWYGFANGVVWPEGGPYPPVPEYPNDQRGWWSTRFGAQMVFYDPADLAAVAKGKAQPHEPQPYAVMDLGDVFFTDRPREQHRVGDVAFDASRGILYIMELHGDEDKPLIHVWKIKARP